MLEKSCVTPMQIARVLLGCCARTNRGSFQPIRDGCARNQLAPQSDRDVGNLAALDHAAHRLFADPDFPCRVTNAQEMIRFFSHDLLLYPSESRYDRFVPNKT